MSQTIVKVYAATVDREKVVLFHDGRSTTMLQGDPRIPEIIEILKSRHFDIHNPVLLDLEKNLPRNEVLEEFVEKNSFLRLFRVAKSVLKELLYGEEPQKTVAPVPLVPGTYGIPVDTIPQKSEQAQKNVQVIEQIQAAAQPLSVIQEDTTVVAVVGDTFVSGVENLTEQMRHSLKEDSQGTARFFQRLSEVAALRKHSAVDLMKFLQKGDLPLAEDGSIIAYKILKKTDEAGIFADPHTGKVHQKVGDRVCMDESLVDPNRHRECSSGLHVARMDYLPHFNGTHIFLIRIRPEDVVAVPYADGSKMRVLAYEILLELPQDIRKLLLERKSLLNHPAGAEILSKALSLGFAPPTREVRITGQMGLGIVVTDLVPKPVPEKVDVVEAKDTPVETVETTTPPPPTAAFIMPSVEAYNRERAAPVLPQELSKERKTKQQQQQAADVKVGSRQEQAIKLMRQFQTGKSNTSKLSAATELKKFKRESKVSWDRLGISATEVAVVEDFLQTHG